MLLGPEIPPATHSLARGCLHIVFFVVVVEACNAFNKSLSICMLFYLYDPAYLSMLVFDGVLFKLAFDGDLSLLRFERSLLSIE